MRKDSMTPRIQPGNLQQLALSPFRINSYQSVAKLTYIQRATG